ncbi:hypothetical protein [Neotabrizicola sp. sgz301269]|uniref:hypothetical protein n=1 Tax=Neotabrizicola sp. sgz301269 TaxID=3276282 RepID=UPI00376FDB7E
MKASPALCAATVGFATGAWADESLIYSELTCAFPKAALGTELDVRNADHVVCALQVERTTKKPATGFGKLFSLGTYARTRDVPISMSGRRIVAYIELGLTDFPKEGLEKCFSSMQTVMVANERQISASIAAQNADTFSLTCAEGQKL